MTIMTDKLKSKVIAKLSKCNNEEEVKKMVDKHFEYAASKYKSLKSICECIITIY